MGEHLESHNVCESVTEGLLAHFTIFLVYQEQLPRSFGSRLRFVLSERRRKGTESLVRVPSPHGETQLGLNPRGTLE